jgi:hypothetical protein
MYVMTYRSEEEQAIDLIRKGMWEHAAIILDIEPDDSSYEEAERFLCRDDGIRAIVVWYFVDKKYDQIKEAIHGGDFEKAAELFEIDTLRCTHEHACKLMLNGYSLKAAVVEFFARCT